MDTRLFHYVVVLLIQKVLSDCPEYVFRIVPLKDFLASDHLQIVYNVSVHGCAELCVSHDGDSFSFNTETNSCYIHKHRVSYGYSTGSRVRGVVIYWRESNECPTSYAYNDTHNVCYKIAGNYKNWTESASLCEEDRGVLFVASESWKYDLLVDIFRDAKYDQYGVVLFVGANNITSTYWRWMDGSPTTNWADGEPNSNVFNIEQCAALKQDAGNDHRLMDIGCDRTQLSICEIPMRKK